MTSKIDLIGESLGSLVRKRKIISRCELLQSCYEAVRAADLDDLERAELEKLVGGKIASGIFSCIVGGAPVFKDFPRVDSFIVIHGRIFHFLHTGGYDKSDFERAYAEFDEAKGKLLALVAVNLEDLAAEFLEGAGYHLDSKMPAELIFSKGEDRLKVLVYPRISEVNLQECMACAGEEPRSCAVVVPHEESLPPFIKFFGECGSSFEDAGIQVWVANMEQGTIDPFIGFATDMDIYTQFKNPRLASMVRSTWGKIA